MSGRNKDAITGAISELMVAQELLIRGYRVSQPITPSSPYDYVIETSEGFVKIQVKAANTRTVAIWRGNRKNKRPYSASDYDYLVVVVPKGFYVIDRASVGDSVVICITSWDRFYGRWDLLPNPIRVAEVPVKPTLSQDILPFKRQKGGSNG